MLLEMLWGFLFQLFVERSYYRFGLMTFLTVLIDLVDGGGGCDVDYVI